MKKLVAALAVFGGATALADEAKDKVIALAAETECRLTRAQAEEALPAQGVPLEEVNRILQVMRERGDAVFADNAVQLSDLICPENRYVQDKALADRIVSLFAARGCAMDGFDYSAMIKSEGLPERGSWIIMLDWREAGLAALPIDNFRLSPELCPPS